MALEQLALPLITISDIFGKLLSISKDQSTTAADDDDEKMIIVMMRKMYFA